MDIKSFPNLNDPKGYVNVYRCSCGKISGICECGSHYSQTGIATVEEYQEAQKTKLMLLKINNEFSSFEYNSHIGNGLASSDHGCFINDSTDSRPNQPSPSCLFSRCSHCGAITWVCNCKELYENVSWFAAQATMDEIDEFRKLVKEHNMEYEHDPRMIINLVYQQEDTEKENKSLKKQLTDLFVELAKVKEEQTQLIKQTTTSILQQQIEQITGLFQQQLEQIKLAYSTRQNDQLEDVEGEKSLQLIKEVEQEIKELSCRSQQGMLKRSDGKRLLMLTKELEKSNLPYKKDGKVYFTTGGKVKRNKEQSLSLWIFQLLLMFSEYANKIVK